MNFGFCRVAVLAAIDGTAEVQFTRKHGDPKRPAAVAMVNEEELRAMRTACDHALELISTAKAARNTLNSVNEDLSRIFREHSQEWRRGR